MTWEPFKHPRGEHGRFQKLVVPNPKPQVRRRRLRLPKFPRIPVDPRAGVKDHPW